MRGSDIRDDMLESDEFTLPREPQHSGLGIASFIIALFAGLMDLILVVTAGVLEASRPGALDDDSPVAMLIGAGLMFGFLAVLTGIGLGIAGLNQRNRRLVFAVLGVAFNALILVGTCLLIVVGMALG